MKYFEIYSVEHSAEKISDYLDAVLESKPNMYSKTKDRYRELAVSLLKSVEKISQIIQEESLVPDSSDEFNEVSVSSLSKSSAVLSAAQHTVEMLDEAKRFRVVKPADEVEPSPEKSLSDILAPEEVINLTPESKQMTVNSYFSVFSSTEKALANSSSEESYRCAALIRRWFEARFILNNTPEFKYNIKQMPSWVSGMILAYGKHLSQGSADKFVKDIDKWIGDVKSGNNKSWAVPYPVLAITRSQDASDFTIHAVLLNDILYNTGYYNLSRYTDNRLPINCECDDVTRLVSTKNPDLLDTIRTRRQNNSKLLVQCRLEGVN